MATPVYNAGTWGDVIGIVDDNGKYVVPTDAEWATLVTQVNMASIPKPLSVVQSEACGAIDAKTNMLLVQGFTDSGTGLNFPLDQASQIIWLGMLELGPAGALTFPIQFTATNGQVASWANWTDLSAVTAEALTTFQTVSGGGAALKSQIMAATTIDEVNAIQDTRT